MARLRNRSTAKSCFLPQNDQYACRLPWSAGSIPLSHKVHCPFKPPPTPGQLVRRPQSTLCPHSAYTFIRPTLSNGQGTSTGRGRIISNFSSPVVHLLASELIDPLWGLNDLTIKVNLASNPIPCATHSTKEPSILPANPPRRTVPHTPTLTRL